MLQTKHRLSSKAAEVFLIEQSLGALLTSWNVQAPCQIETISDIADRDRNTKCYDVAASHIPLEALLVTSHSPDCDDALYIDDVVPLFPAAGHVLGKLEMHKSLEHPAAFEACTWHCSASSI